LVRGLMNRLVLALGITANLYSQAPTFRVPVRVVSVPTAVVAADGKFVSGLERDQFRLFDNDKQQNPRVDLVEQPLSVAIVVQVDRGVRAWLPEVKKAPSVVEGQLVGETGEAALFTFSDEVRQVQRLTRDTTALDKAFAGLAPSGFGRRTLDAILAAATELKGTAAERRRVILLIAQAGDADSAASARDVLRELEENDITVYSLAMPAVGKDLIQSSIFLRGVSYPDVGFIGGVDLGKLVPEIYRGVKAKERRDAVSVMTGEMGGLEIPFRAVKDLEAGISTIGEELHTEYELSFSPTNPEVGYHRIRVEVDRAGVKLRARPGYYVAGEDGR
jgi:VWFA-related protein